MSGESAEVAPRCVGRKETKRECAECKRGAKRRGNKISRCDLVYMNICSLRCKNQEKRKGKGRTIRKQKWQVNDTRN